MCIIFIRLAFIYPETFPQVLLETISGPHPNHKYGFASPTGLWKFMVRVLVFVISSVAINKLIGFKVVPQV